MQKVLIRRSYSGASRRKRTPRLRVIAFSAVWSVALYRRAIGLITALALVSCAASAPPERPQKPRLVMVEAGVVDAGGAEDAAIDAPFDAPPEAAPVSDDPAENHRDTRESL